MRFLGPLAILAIAAFLLRDKMPFLAEGYQQVLDANNVGLVLALIVTIGSMFAMAEVMRLLLMAGGTKVSLWKTAELTFVANAWSSTFPGGAAISTVYQYQTMRKWDVSVIVSSWFIVVSGVLSTLWLVGLGIVSILFLGASFSIWPLLGSATVMLGIAVLVYLATTHPKATSRIICSEVRTFNRLMRRDPERWIPAIRKHVRQLHAVHLPRRRFALIAALSLANWMLEILGLWLCIWAVTGALPGLERVGENPSFLGVILAFVTAKIVGTAQVTPAGLGPVEAAMTASLVAVGMTASSAFGAVFVYRILAFALMTILGWIIYLISVARGGMKAGEQS
ncbi:lysylphosphatidylglycerol synthase transmembrane domain-containing protein [Corynebacterium gerontici]|uniref:lysylphosphatidylglycerol synthase transmembrane domain-containing protein n=1 Tax=Corynebacterium gerontici TaxID=2079234 RepID=UPI000F510F28|nr:YbhN family protein [Corynebacterium gerontici]